MGHMLVLFYQIRTLSTFWAQHGSWGGQRAEQMIPDKLVTSQPSSASDPPQIKELLASSDEEEEVKPAKIEKSYVPKITGRKWGAGGLGEG